MGVNSIIGEFLIDYGYIIALAVGIIVVSLIVVTKTRKKNRESQSDWKRIARRIKVKDISDVRHRKTEMSFLSLYRWCILIAL